MAAVEMEVSVGAVRLRNPVIAAAGTCGYGVELAGMVDLARLGGLVVKGLSLRPARGHPPPRFVETPAGVLNAIGLQNIGVEAFLKEKLPVLARVGTRVIANFWGNSVGEFAEVAARLDGAEGIDALELNVSSPNKPEWGKIIASDPAATAAIVREVRKRTRLPLWVKLSPNVSDIAAVARAAASEGADAISAINTLKGLAVDLEGRRPKLAAGSGGLSGPAIKPVALRMVREVAAAVDLPVIGVGGIRTGRDALEFMVCGASAVEVGTATLYDPRAPVRIAWEMERWCRSQGVRKVATLVGTLRT